MTFGTLKILGFPEGGPGISINVGRCLTIGSRKWISSIASLDFCRITPQMQENSRYRVFIVDDHPVVRDGLKNLIEQEEDLVVCGEAADAATALQTIPETSPDIALVDLS